MLRFRTTVTLLCSSLLLACAPDATPVPEIPRFRNLILISIDTLRADRLGAYGYDRPTSPTLDSLAASGVRFENAIADSSWTLPTHMTMMTGLWPSSHQMIRFGEKSARLGDDIPTLAEVLRRSGFRTFAHTAGGFMSGDFGFGRGFERYDDDRKETDAILERARRTLQRVGADERFFLFLHTFDVHCPYAPPDRYVRMFAPQGLGRSAKLAERCGFNLAKLSDADVQLISDLYDAGIRAVDDQLAAFLDFLRKRPDLDDTLLVILSDHGEEFLEHGEIGHGRGLFIEVLRVPWILWAPGMTPRVIREPVGLVDVMPTLLDLLSVEAPEMQGRSQRARILGETEVGSQRPVFSEVEGGNPSRSIIQGHDHLIVERDRALTRLYDLDRDPGETQDRFETDAETAQSLERRLESHDRGIQREQHPTQSFEVDDELRSELEALGYVGE